MLIKQNNSNNAAAARRQIAGVLVVVVVMVLVAVARSAEMPLDPLAPAMATQTETPDQP